MMEGMGLDPNLLVNTLANKNNNNDGAFGGNGLLWIFLLILFWGGGNGFGNRGQESNAAVEGQIEAALAKANAAGCSDQLLLTAINGNKEAINSIATTFGVNINQVENGIRGLERGICDLGYKNGQDTASIISAVTSGNTSLSQQLCDCCCKTQRSIDSLRYDMATSCCETNRNIDSIKVAMDKCCCETNRNIDSVRYDMANGFCATNTNIDKSIAGLERAIDYKIDQQSLEMRAGFQGIRDYLNAEKVAALQTELQSAQFQISQISQTQAIKDTVASYFGCPPGVIPCCGCTGNAPR